MNLKDQKELITSLLRLKNRQLKRHRKRYQETQLISVNIEKLNKSQQNPFDNSKTESLLRRNTKSSLKQSK